MARGGYREGAGRPPGTPNKISQHIREALAPLDQPAIERLQKLIQSQDEAVAIRAIELHLNYRAGKPRYQVEVESRADTRRVRPEDLAGLPEDVLRRLAGIDDQEIGEPVRTEGSGGQSSLKDNE